MVAVQQQSVIAASPAVNIDKTSAGIRPEDFEVKGDRGSRESYNVWNDDWSK